MILKLLLSIQMKSQMFIKILKNKRGKERKILIVFDEMVEWLITKS